MPSSNSSSIDPRVVLNEFFRHRGKMLVISLSIVALTLVALVYWPRSFESEAKLFVRLGRENMTLDPTATTGATVAFQKHQEEEINSVLEILNSRETLQRVVDEIGPDAVLSPSSGSSDDGNPVRSVLTQVKSAVGSAADVFLTSTGLRNPVSDREEAIRKLGVWMKAKAARRSGVVTITSRGPSPQAAQQFVATATKMFLEHHVALSRTAGSHDFFTQQTDLLRDQLAEAAGLLRDQKTKYGIVTVEGTQTKLLQESSAV